METQTITPSLSSAAPALETPSLSPRQWEVLRLLVQGRSNKEIARTLGLAVGTVKIPTAILFSKMGVTGRTAAAVAGAKILALQEQAATSHSEGCSLRQQEVLRLLVQGCSNKEIAHTLVLGTGTVKIHVAALCRKLGVTNRAAAAVAGAALLAQQDQPSARRSGGDPASREAVPASAVATAA